MRKTLPGARWARIFFVVAAAAGLGGVAAGGACAGNVATTAFPAPAATGPAIAALADTSNKNDSGFTPLVEPSPGAGGGFTPLDETPSRDASPGVKPHEASPAAPATPDVAAPDTLPQPLTPEVAAPDVLPAPAIPAFTVKVTVPALTAVGSSVDEATLRDILSGKVAENADAIANLSATSITIPEIDVAMTITAGKANNLALTLRDIVFDTVTGGVARSVTIGSVESRSDAGGRAHIEKVSAEQVNLGLMLQLYGLVKGDPTAPLSLAYSDFTSAGGTFSGPGASCTFGKFSAARVEARPLKVSLSEFTQLAADVGTDTGKPSRRAMGRLVDTYADLLTAFRTSPVRFGGFDCNGVGEDSTPFKFSIGGMTVGGFGGLRYPDFIVHDIDVNAGDKGTFSLGEFHLKGFDFSSVLEAAKAFSASGDGPPSEDDYRGFVPAFEGFAMSDFNIDVPDEQDPGQRVKAKLADFDIDLGNYINGIPSQFSSHASHLVVALPATSTNSSVQTLLSVGLRDIDVSYDLAAYRDTTSKEIRLTRFALDGADLGSIVASSVIGQASDDLFSKDTAAVTAAITNLTVKRVFIHIADQGLGDLLAKAAAGTSGKGVAEIRRSSAALVQATLLFFLGGAANSAEVGSAVGKFINGARSLSISAMSSDPAGVGIGVLQSLTDNPADIGNQITIDAVAR